MKPSIKLIIAMLLAILTPVIGSAANRYVATNGNDLADGTLAAPYRTIQRAFDMASPGDTIFVREGTYREEVALTGKSGSAGNPITLRNYTNERAVLSGLDVAALTWVGTSLPGVTKPVYVASYTGLVFEQMFFNSKPLMEARWPNVPKDANGDWNFFSPDVWAAVNSSGNNYGTITDSDLATASGTSGWNRSINGVRAVLNVDHQYTSWTRLATNHVAGSGTFNYPTDLGSSVNNPDETGSSSSFNDDRYYLVGERDFLDTPGEWYFDAANQLLYLCPPDGVNPNSAQVEVKTRNYSLTADRSCNYLTIDGITFFGTAFSFGNGQNNRSNDIIFRNNTVLYPCWTEWLAMPSTDPRASYQDNYPMIQADNSVVANNSFAYGAMSALLINGWNNVIENNVVHDFDYSSTLGTAPMIVSRNWASYVGKGGAVTVRYNTIYNSGGILLHVGQSNNLVYQNQLYNAFRACWGGNKDVSALYTQSAYCQGTRFYRNWVYDSKVGTSPQPWNGGLGIRGDDSTSGLTVDHNVCWNLGSAGIMIKNVTNPVLVQANACYHNTVFNHSLNNNTQSAIIISTDTTQTNGQNSVSSVANNMAQQIYGGWSAKTLGALALYAGNSTGTLTESQLENTNWFDFRPAASASPVLNTGIAISNITGTTVGVPDIGAYERGDSVYWIPGQRGRKASFPIVPDGATSVPLTRDALMWRPAYNAASHRLYLGTNRTAVLNATTSSPEYQGAYLDEANVFPLPALSGSPIYYWRVDAVMPDSSVVAGDLWQFTPALAYTLAYAAGPNGTLNVTSPQIVAPGGSGSAVTAVANVGYRFLNWSDGSTANPRTDSNVTSHVTVTANFAINTYTLAYNAGPNGTVSGTSPQTVNHGASGTAVTAVPGTGYRFVNWSDGSTANPRTDINVTSDLTVSANFAAGLTTLTLTNTGPVTWTVPAGVTSVQVQMWGGGGGGGSSSTNIPGAGGGGGGGAYILTNLAVTPGASISYAIGGGGTAGTAGTNTTFTGAPTANGGKAGSTGPNGSGGAGGVGGTFNGGNGAAGTTTTNGPTAVSGGGGGGAGSAGHGGNASASIGGAAGSPDGAAGAAGKTTDGRGVDGTMPGGGGSGAVQLTGSSSSGGTGGNGQIRLTWMVNTYTLTYNAGPNGTVNGTSPQTVIHGASGTAVTAMPGAGCRFVNWSDGGTANPRTDSNVTSHVTVTANFAINTYTLAYNAGPNGTVSGTSPQTVNHGASGTAVTAVPGTGYRFVNWSDGSTANPRTDINVTSDLTVSANFAAGLTTLTLTNTGPVTWTVPAGVTSVQVQMWGGGGGGGSSSTNIPGAGGGGGGGAYILTNLAVTPGASISYAIGGGGTAGTAGTNTTFTGAPTANGGKAGSTGPNGSGGAGGVGGTFNGGNGAAGTTTTNGPTAVSGGGGGGAGSAGHGGNASASIGGAAGSPDGAAGAAGKTTDGRGVDGTMPGGGGSGAVQLTGSSSSGGTGGNGQIILTWMVGGFQPFDTWIATFPALPIGSRGQNDDPDGDGLSNLQEYIVGTNPANSDAPTQLVITNNSGNLSVAFTANAASGSGYAGTTRYFDLWSRPDLSAGSWVPVPGYTNIVGANQLVTYGINSSQLFFCKLNIRLQ